MKVINQILQSSWLLFFSSITVQSFRSLGRTSFNSAPNSNRIHAPQTQLATSALSAKAPNVVVVGFAGGIAENIAYRLHSEGMSVSAVLDERPVSPFLKEIARKARDLPIYIGDYSDKEQVLREYNAEGSKSKGSSLAQLLSSSENILIATGDTGEYDKADAEGREASSASSETGEREVNAMLSSLARALSSSSSVATRAIVCALGASDSVRTAGKANAFSQFFNVKGSDAFRKYSTSKNIPLSTVSFGGLTGGVPGAEPLPFLSLPLLEPELHPSYTLQSVVLTSADGKYASSEICTRGAITEVLARMITKGIYKNELDAQVLSIVGEPPSEKDWNQIFARLTAGDGVEILRVDFGSILKKQALVNWIADTWFPQALIDADAATILTGARPVRAVKMADSAVRIRWEDLNQDLTTKLVGEIEIRVTDNIGSNSSTDGSGPGISVIRLAGQVLPGEMQLMDRLIEGVNKNVFKKLLVTPVSTESK